MTETPASAQDTGLPPRNPAPDDPDFGCGPRYYYLFGARKVGRTSALENARLLLRDEALLGTSYRDGAGNRIDPLTIEGAVPGHSRRLFERLPKPLDRGGAFLSALRRVSVRSYQQARLERDFEIADSGMGC